MAISQSAPARHVEQPPDASVVVNPVTGEAAGHVPRLGAEDVVAAVETARDAQQAWGAMSFRQRARSIIRFHDAILDRREELFEVMRAESGKSWRDCFAELFAVASEARFYAYNGERMLRPHAVKPAIPLRDRTKVAYLPVGVVGIISPWNFPFILTIGDAIPALLAGNSVVIKPSSQTPLTAIWARDLMVDCGVPAAVLQVVTGPAAELANALVDHVDCVTFTGSTEIGRTIAERAAARLIPYCMELGGKNALIVMPGGNLKHAATVTIDGSFNNNGQVCVSFERIYVHEAMYDSFKAELVKQTEAVRLDKGPGYHYDVGSMVNKGQMESVEAHVKDAVKKGAAVLSGGKRRPDLGPAYFEPTILENVTADMKAYADETFGPVISLYRVGSADEAVNRANASNYGLHYGVYIGDLREGERIARRLQAGSVCVNDSYVNWASIEAPMGGVKDSGVGRRHGEEGIRRFTHPQTVLTNMTNFQISSQETALSINKRLADALVALLKIWRHIPFIR